jgi:phage shock protein PspC (stress-responsive transcriptional regulator)
MVPDSTLFAAMLRLLFLLLALLGGLGAMFAVLAFLADLIIPKSAPPMRFRRPQATYKKDRP